MDPPTTRIVVALLFAAAGLCLAPPVASAEIPPGRTTDEQRATEMRFPPPPLPGGLTFPAPSADSATVSPRQPPANLRKKPTATLRNPPPQGDPQSTPVELRKQPLELPSPPEFIDPEPLPPLEEELWYHGGSYLYAPEGDRLNWPHHDPHAHVQLLRLPEDWYAPQPITLFDDFLGTGPIPHRPHLRWPHDGYHWDPRLVLYGSYEVIATALEENDQRQDLLGHQLLVDLDCRLTGTERLHAQWRPLGERNTGGSFYRFSNPEGYIDNSTGIPDRYWVEWELASVLGGYLKNQFVPRDYHVVVGKFPFAVHNQLLINDDVLGLAINKNTIYLGTLSNLNVQAVIALDDVEAFSDGSANLYLLNATADYRHAFIESTYAYVQHGRFRGRDAQYAAISVTKFFGPHNVAGRALFRMAPDASGGSGELVVLEYNRPRLYSHNFLAIEKSVFYVTAFRATEGWQSISGGNFDRVRTAFAVDPLIPLSAARAPDDNVGLAMGIQFFRHHEDESIIPEVAYDSPAGDAVFGIGLRYQRKTGPRTFFELQGVANFSENPMFRREGVFLSETLLF
ncbi:MAG: hypothetical protein DWQ42_18955 [Planctomycetota bacterium]|nr:MAG: hypothetical protein DWQ42_18955 [Planctomycetota bacterium]REK43166.1 MAG: hypothetical protein DWQ46_12400 [Planctomycetota bacterium]